MAGFSVDTPSPYDSSALHRVYNDALRPANDPSMEVFIAASDLHGQSNRPYRRRQSLEENRAGHSQACR